MSRILGSRVTWAGRVRDLISLRAAVAVALLLALLVGAERAGSATTTFTVDFTGDASDVNLGDGVCDSDLTGTVACTLRAAIQEANAFAGADTINFQIPGTDPNCNATTGVCTISPASPLPAITEQATIDGYSQTGASPATETSNAVLKIELDGTNAENGLRIQAANSTVMGLIINRFGGAGVVITGPGATGNTVEGNYLGTDAAGTADLGNLYGVDIRGSSNTVGGTESGARNIISGNVIGVAIFGDEAATNNKVMANYIGTDASGTADLGNNLGVLINGASSNTVGGTESGARNIISGSTSCLTCGIDGDGVRIVSLSATGNKVMGNFIGTDASGTADLGNDNDGVSIANEASNNTIGGTTAGAGNIISGNGGDGVEVSYYRDSNNPEDNDSTPPTGNRILSNSIYDNDELGIDLATPPNELPPGVTNNDPKDPDTGPNRRQNFPKLTSATTDTTTTTITGTLNSRPRKTFTIQFFSSPAADADPSGFGEGKSFLGEKTVKTNREGKRIFTTTFVPFEPVSPGEKITATVTNTVTGDTSEFSAAREVT